MNCGTSLRDRILDFNECLQNLKVNSANRPHADFQKQPEGKKIRSSYKLNWPATSGRSACMGSIPQILLRITES